MASGSRYLLEWVHNWILNFNVVKTHLSGSNVQVT